MDIVDPGLAAPVLDNVDLGRAVDLVRQVCRIPSVLGDEGGLAAFLAGVMRESGFESVDLQPVAPGRPNAIGEVSLGPGRRVVLTGHTDTKPESHGWQRAAPFSGDLIDGAVYGHGVMDMKAALACQIVAIEAVRASGLPLVRHAGHGGRLRPHGGAGRFDRLFRRATPRTCVSSASSPITRSASGIAAGTTLTSRCSAARRTPATSTPPSTPTRWPPRRCSPWTLQA